MGNRSAQRRHTGDDDGEVGFDDGPHAAVDGLPHAVSAYGGQVEGCEAEDGGDADTEISQYDSKVLTKNGRKGWEEAYNAPNPKTPMRAILVRLANLSSRISSAGMVMMMRSVPML